jgi:hypothetical protein
MSNSVINPLILVTHVPKCCGTSLRYAICKAFDISEKSFYYPGWKSLGKGAWQRVGRSGLSRIFWHHPADFDYLLGHHPWGVHYLFRPWSKVALRSRKKPIFIATLRHPIDQMISFYYYHRQLGEKSPHVKTISDAGDIVGFYNAKPLLSNLQARMYCGLPYSTALTWQHSRRVLGDDWLVRKAYNRLMSNYPFWVHHGFLHHSVQNLGRALGVSLNIGKARETVTKERPTMTEVSDATIHHLRSINSMDLKLHEALSPHFDQYCGVGKSL